MPHFYEFEWEGIKVSAKPKGIRRSRFFRFIPYFTGNEPEFKVTLDTISGEQCPFDVELEFLEPGDDEMTPKKSVVNGQEVKTYPIGASGDHKFKIALHTKGLKGVAPRFLGKRNLVTFRAISQEAMIMWAIGILVVIVASIVNLVLGS